MNTILNLSTLTLHMTDNLSSTLNGLNDGRGPNLKADQLWGIDENTWPEPTPLSGAYPTLGRVNTWGSNISTHIQKILAFFLRRTKFQRKWVLSVNLKKTKKNPTFLPLYS